MYHFIYLVHSYIHLFVGSSVTFNRYETSTTCSGPAALGYPLTAQANLACASQSNFGPQEAVQGYGGYVTCYSPPSSSSSSSSCLAGSESVTLESGSVVSISDVKVGDKLLAYSSASIPSEVAEVVVVPRLRDNMLAYFLHIVLEAVANYTKTIELMKRTPRCWLRRRLQ